CCNNTVVAICDCVSAYYIGWYYHVTHVCIVDPSGDCLLVWVFRVLWLD
ncbi:21928_t:CDS:2, partial [Gigaspora rosea]